MTPAERFQRLREIFMQACELPSAERDRFLSDTCGDDNALRQEIERLLAHDARESNVVDAAVQGQVADELAADLAADPEPELTPERIGSYRVVRVVGRGGMGTVYQAEQENPQRRVALKMVRPGLGRAPMLKRLQREAQLLGRLQHPGIAQVYEAGFATIDRGRHPYFAMEYIDGLPLTAFAERLQLCTRARLELVARACDAAHYAHERGIIHRDLKPGNILVINRDDAHEQAQECGASAKCGEGFKCAGQPKIVDFGVARAMDTDMATVSLQTDVGHLVGTLSYMSPEQIAGNPADLDRRCDIYALGVILHELLAGRPPHEVSSRTIPEAARIIRDEEPSRLGSINNVYRGDIETIVGKALDKDPARRYQTAARMAADIRRFLHHQPIEARPAGAIYRLGKFARRNRVLAGGVATTFVALVIGLLSTTWLAMRESRAHQEADRALYRAGLAVAGAALREGDVVTAKQHLAAVPEALRGWEWSYYHAQLDQSTISLKFAQHDNPSPSIQMRGVAHVWFSEDDQRVHVARRCLVDNRVEVGTWDVASGRRVHEWHVAGAFRMAPLLDRTTLIVQATDLPQLYDATHGVADRALDVPLMRGPRGHIHSLLPAPTLSWEPSPQLELLGKDASFVVFSPDFRHVCSASRFTDVRLFSLDAGGAEIAVPPHPEGIGDAIFSSDGRYLFTAGNDRRLACFDLQEAGLMVWEQPESHDDAVLAAALSPDGRTLVTGGQDRVVRVWDAQTGTAQGKLLGHRDPIFALAFCSNGSRVASFSDNDLRLWNIDVARDLTIMRGHTGFVRTMAMSPDGSLLASGGAELRIWDVARAKLVLEKTHDDDTWYQHLSFSPDGRRLLVNREIRTQGTRRGEALMIDARNGRTVESLSARVYQGRVASSPAGNRLIIGSSAHAYQLLDGDTLTPISELGDPRIFRFDRSGRRLAYATKTELLVCDADDGRIIRSWPQEYASSICFLRDGAWLASASAKGTVKLFDVASGRLQGTLTGHAGKVTCMTELASHGRLITGSDDRTIRLWDINRFEEVCVLRGHADRIWDLTVTPDERTIFSASGDYTIRRWDTRPTRDIMGARGQ